jgi:hypothetical protein
MKDEAEDYSQICNEYTQGINFLKENKADY